MNKLIAKEIASCHHCMPGTRVG